MKLHMHKVSTTSRAVLLFIEDAKLDVELVTVDLMTGEHMQEPFSKLNPNKLVPVLEDGSFVLSECSAILKYLAEKTGSPAYPTEIQARARVNEAMDWLNTGFSREYSYHLVYPQIFPHHVREPEAAQNCTLEWGKAQASGMLETLNGHWLGGGNGYLCGNDVTIADYMGAAYVSLGDAIRVDLSGYGNVGKWLDSMRSRPAWGAVYDVFDGFAGSMKDKTFTSIG